MQGLGLGRAGATGRDVPQLQCNVEAHINEGGGYTNPSFNIFLFLIKPSTLAILSLMEHWLALLKS
jgi:hypothetical protein